jgi:hypothetical protein
MWARKNKNLPVSEFFTKIAYVQVINFITVKSFHAVYEKEIKTILQKILMFIKYK